MAFIFGHICEFQFVGLIFNFSNPHIFKLSNEHAVSVDAGAFHQCCADEFEAGLFGYFFRYIFIFLFKHRAGNIDKPPARFQMAGYVTGYSLLEGGECG